MSGFIHGLVAVMVGFAGYGLGWLSRGIAMDDLEQTRRARVGNGRRSGKWGLVGGGLILLLAVAGMFQLVSLTVQARDATACFERQANAARTANITLANSTITMVDSLFSPEGTVDSRRKAVEDWRDAYRKYLEEVRAKDVQRCINE